jgi:hypothetical protein
MHVETIWLRRIGDKVQVLFQGLGGWRLAIEESVHGSFSHIVEHRALQSAPLDDVSSKGE